MFYTLNGHIFIVVNTLHLCYEAIVGRLIVVKVSSKHNISLYLFFGKYTARKGFEVGVRGLELACSCSSVKSRLSIHIGF